MIAIKLTDEARPWWFNDFWWGDHHSVRFGFTFLANNTIYMIFELFCITSGADFILGLGSPDVTLKRGEEPRFSDKL